MSISVVQTDNPEVAALVAAHNATVTALTDLTDVARSKGMEASKEYAQRYAELFPQLYQVLANTLQPGDRGPAGL